jgi:hypothetical protein
MSHLLHKRVGRLDDAQHYDYAQKLEGFANSLPLHCREDAVSTD